MTQLHFRAIATANREALSNRASRTGPALETNGANGSGMRTAVGKTEMPRRPKGSGVYISDFSFGRFHPLIRVDEKIEMPLDVGRSWYPFWSHTPRNGTLSDNKSPSSITIVPGELLFLDN